MPNQDVISLVCMQILQNLHFPSWPLRECYFIKKNTISTIKKKYMILKIYLCFFHLIDLHRRTPNSSPQTRLAAAAAAAIANCSWARCGVCAGFIAWPGFCAARGKQIVAPLRLPLLLTLHPASRHWCSVFAVCLPQPAPIGWAGPCRATGAALFTFAV